MAKRKKREIPLVWANEPLSDVEVAVHSNARPTREQLRQGDFDKGWQIGKEIGAGFRRVDSLVGMHRRGNLTDEQLDAALRFRATFDKAQLHGIKSRAFDPTPRSQNRVGNGLADSVMVARERVADAIDELGGQGGPVAEVAWWIVGLGLSIEEYAVRGRWNGKPLSPPVVSGLLLAAISVLVGMRRRRQAAPERRSTKA